MQQIQEEHQQQSAMMISQHPQLAQWQADRICTAALSGSPAALTAALTAVGCFNDAASAFGEAALSPADTAAIVNCRDSARCLTPLHCAATAVAAAAQPCQELDAGAAECAAMLLTLGANPNARDGHGCTPLHYAARYASPLVCQRLLACRSTRVDLRNAWGRTALMFAAWGGDETVALINGNELKRLEIAQGLLSAGANVDVRDSRGRTALMWAAMTGKVALLRLLLSFGADWRRRNYDGLTAAQLAQREGLSETARLLNAAAEDSLKSPTAVVSPIEGQEGGAAQKDGTGAGTDAGVNVGTGTA